MLRTRPALTALFVTGFIAFLGWQISEIHEAPKPAALPAPAAKPSVSPNSSAAPSSSLNPNPTPSTAPSSGTAVVLHNGKFAGDSSLTKYGNVQVQISIAGGRIIDVVALHLTDSSGHSVQISNQAAPILRTEVLASQSADIATVSGASYTTAGYTMSLQSAIDNASH